MYSLRYYTLISPVSTNIAIIKTLKETLLSFSYYTTT